MRGANPIKTNRSRSLRRNSTDAKRKLWRCLRARSLDECKFVRQQPIGPYVADFVCRERRLIIEVDGGQHASDPRDASREAYLIRNHYRVLRFWNNDVLTNIDGVLETVSRALKEDAPHPDGFAVRPLPASGER